MIFPRRERVECPTIVERAHAPGDGPPRLAFRLHAVTAAALALLAATTSAKGAAVARAARVLHVLRDAPPGGDGSREHPLMSIAEGIRRSRDGDTVLVGPGLYVERIDFGGRAIVVRSSDGPEATVIDADREGPVARFATRETRDSVLEGFTLSRGLGEFIGGSRAGGGILVVDADPTLVDLRVEHCGSDLGGGVAILGGRPDLRRCEIVHNEGRVQGGGVWVEGGEPRFFDCRIEHNRAIGGRDLAAGGGACLIASRAWFENCGIRDNEAANGNGGGLAISDRAAPLVDATTVAQNRAPNGLGGGIWIDDASTPTLERSMVVGNLAAGGAGIGCADGSVALVDGAVDANEALERVAARRFGGGGLLLLDGARAFVDASRLRGNTARYVGDRLPVPGGGIAMRDSELRLTATTLETNASRTGEGGALAATRSSLHATGCRLLGNLAREGAAFASEASTIAASRLLIVENGDASSSGAILARDSDIELAFATIAENPVAADREVISLEGTNRVSIAASILVDAEARRALRSGADLGSTRVRPLVDAGPDDAAAIHVRASIVEGDFDGGIDVIDVARPGFVDASRGDFRLRLDSICVDRGDGGAVDPLVPRGPDIDGDPGSIDGDLDGDAASDWGADELVPEIAVRFGTVALAEHRSANVLRVNGSAGDDRRVVRMSVGDPLRLTLDTSPAGPAPARYAIYGWIDAPDRSTMRALPFALGWIGRGTYFEPSGTDLPRRVWNTAGHRRRLGVPTEASTLAPTTLFDDPRGLGMRTILTFQGIVEDAASEADVAASVTNAVVVDTREP